MEAITIAVETRPVLSGDGYEITHTWTNNVESPTSWSTISQMLQEMKEIGWDLQRSTAYAFKGSSRVAYEFKRPVS